MNVGAKKGRDRRKYHRGEKGKKHFAPVFAGARGPQKTEGRKGRHRRGKICESEQGKREGVSGNHECLKSWGKRKRRLQGILQEDNMYEGRRQRR